MSKYIIFIFINDGAFVKYYDLEELKQEHKTIYNMHMYKKYKIKNENTNLAPMQYDSYVLFYSFETRHDLEDLKELFKTTIFEYHSFEILKLLGDLELING